MADDQQKKGSFWTSLPVVLTAIAGILTGTAALLSALGTFSGDEDESGPTPPQPSTSWTSFAPTPPPTPPPTPAPTPSPETAAIEVVYSGDAYGCSLFLQVEIAGVTATPQGLRHTIRDLPVGRQDYRISGQITCPTLGNCEAAGAGQLTVQEGREYALTWRNTDIGECAVSLDQ